MTSTTLSRPVIAAALLLGAFGSQATVTLASGESHQTAFGLQSEGQYILSSDFFWDAQLQAVDSAATEPYSGTGVLSVSFFENIDFTGLVYSTSIDSSSAAFGAFLGGEFTPRFEDHTGSIRISYTGIGTVELQSITVSNRAGSQGPFFNATTTFEPMASPVPAPPSLALFLPGLLVTAVVAARRRRVAASV